MINLELTLPVLNSIEETPCRGSCSVIYLELTLPVLNSIEETSCRGRCSVIYLELALPVLNSIEETPCREGFVRYLELTLPILNSIEETPCRGSCFVKYLELTLPVLNSIDVTLVEKYFRNSSGSSHRNVRPPTNQFPDNFASTQKVQLHCATSREFQHDLLWFRINVNMARYIQVPVGILLLHWGRE